MRKYRPASPLRAANGRVPRFRAGDGVGSGLDNNLTPARRGAAVPAWRRLIQLPVGERVAQLVAGAYTHRPLTACFLRQPVVNIVELNLALDATGTQERGK